MQAHAEYAKSLAILGRSDEAVAAAQEALRLAKREGDQEKIEHYSNQIFHWSKSAETSKQQ